MSPSARIPRPVIARSAATWQSVPRPLSQLRCQLPHRGSQDQARGPQRPLPPPLGEVPPQGAERARIPRPVIARRGKAPTRQSVPRPLSQLRCQLPHRGSQDQARESQRPLPPPLGEVPPQGAERARIPRPVIARSAATRQSVPRPKPSPGGRWHGAAVTDEGNATDNRALPTKQL